MIDGLTIESCDLEYNEILPLLQKVDKEFDPPFFKEVDMNQYAQKLQQFGHFVIAKVKDNLAGLAVYYKNDEERYLYIPLFVTIVKYAGEHVGQQVLDAIVKYGKNAFTEIRLQVLKDNLGAQDFYRKQGFDAAGENADKYLMIKKM